MNFQNKDDIKFEENNLDALLRQALACNEKPSPELKEQLISAFRPSCHNSKGISLWWLSAVSGTIFCLAAFAVSPVILSCFPLMLLCVRAAALILCADTWAVTIIGLKIFNLKEAASV